MIRDLLKQYEEINEKIFSAFGLNTSYGEIDSQIDREWTGDEDSVRWIGSDGEIYANDVRSGPYTFDNFVMFYVDNGCGDQFYQIFDKNLENEDIED